MLSALAVLVLVPLGLRFWGPDINNREERVSQIVSQIQMLKQQHQQQEALLAEERQREASLVEERQRLDRVNARWALYLQMFPPHNPDNDQ